MAEFEYTTPSFANPKAKSLSGLDVPIEQLQFEKPLNIAELKIIEKQILPFLEKDPVSALGWLSITNPEILEAYTKDAMHKTELYLKALSGSENTLGSYMDARRVNENQEFFREMAQEDEQRPILAGPAADANVVVLGKLPFKKTTDFLREYDIKEGALRGGKKGGTDRLKLNRSEIETLLHELNHVAHNILEVVFSDRQSLDPNLTAPKYYDKEDHEHGMYFRDYKDRFDKPDPIRALDTHKGFPKPKMPFINKTHEAIYRLLSDDLFTEDLAFYNSETVSQGKNIPGYFNFKTYNKRRKYAQIGMPREKTGDRIDDILAKISTQSGMLPSDREYIKTLDGYNKVIQDASQSLLDDLQHTVKSNIMQKKDMIPPKDNVYTLIQELKTGELNEEKEDNEWSISGFIKNLFNK